MSDESAEVRPTRRTRRATTARTAHAPGTSAPVIDPIFGAPNPNTTHWRCERVHASGDREGLAWDAGNGLALDEWPIAELSPAAIRDRWGPGTYRVRWISIDANGARRAVGASRTLLVASSRPGHAPPEAPAPLGALAALDPSATLTHALSLVDAIDRRAAAAAERDRTFLAAVIQASNGPRAADGELAAALRQLAAAQEQTTAAIAALGARVAELEGDDDDDDDESDESEAAPFGPDDDPIAVARTAAMNGLYQHGPELLGALARRIDAEGKPAPTPAPTANGAASS